VWWIGGASPSAVGGGTQFGEWWFWGFSVFERRGKNNIERRCRKQSRFGFVLFQHNLK